MGVHNILYDLYQADYEVTQPVAAGTLYVDDKQLAICNVDTTAGALAFTLAQAPKPGLICAIILDTDGGDLTLTVTGGYNFDGDTSITFDDAGDYVVFMSMTIAGTAVWRAIRQEGTTATVEDISVDTLTATTGAITTLTATSLKLAVTAVAAAGSLIGEGGDLLAGLNVVSAADNTKCVDLPATVAGTVVIVSSQTAAKSLPVFPPASSSIDNLAANAAKTIGAATATTGAVFVADNATHWVTVLGDTA